MGYRELSRMEIVEVVRRWQVGESQRAIARASGVARETVKKYLRAAEELGLAANGPPPTEDQVVRLVQVGRVGERAADVGVAAGRSAGAVSRADHDVAAGGAPAADARAGVAGAARPARPVHHAGTLRRGAWASNRAADAAIRCAWRRRHRARWPRWISNAWACCAIRRRAVSSGSGA